MSEPGTNGYYLESRVPRCIDCNGKYGKCKCPGSDEDAQEDTCRRNEINEAVERALPDDLFEISPHQPSLSSSEPDEWVPTEAEKDALQQAKKLMTEFKTASSTGKLPQPLFNKNTGEVVTSPRTPFSLHRYFEESGVPTSKRAAICRSYASYVAADLAPPTPKKQRTKK